MKPETALTPSPAISPLIEGDPILARVQEHRQSIVRRAYELFKETGFSNGHDLEEWQQAVSEMLRQVPLQVTETDDEISLRAEVPGFTEKDLEVKVDPHRVFIAGKQEEWSESKEDEPIFSERKSKEFLRECLLPAEIETEKVTAELNGGVLNIRLPKSVKSVGRPVARQVA